MTRRDVQLPNHALSVKQKRLPSPFLPGPNGQRGTKNDESAAYWVVYVIGIYEGYYPTINDNEPDHHVATTGATGLAEPEWSAIPMEILRDVADDQWEWSDTEKLHAWQRVVVHEIGHHFELEDDYGDFPNHVMSDYDTDAEEDLLPQVPMEFKESDLKKIRAETVFP